MEVSSYFLHGTCHTSDQSHPGALAMLTVYTCAGRYRGRETGRAQRQTQDESAAPTDD